jgi:hypothetical protein
VKEFVDACIKVTGADIKVEYGPRRTGDYAEVFSDPSKIKRELVSHILRIAWQPGSLPPRRYSIRTLCLNTGLFLDLGYFHCCGTPLRNGARSTPIWPRR